MSPKCFEKKSLSDDLFLHFKSKVQNLTVVSIIYMIRIRFFGPGELKTRTLSGARYAMSRLEPEEREFVVDSGASMHMVSKKDQNEAELETVRVWKNATMVLSASGEVLAKEEATLSSVNWSCS